MVSLLLIKQITHDILDLFRVYPQYRDKIVIKDYHGFSKGRISLIDLRVITQKYDTNPEIIQAEYVFVSKDLSDEVHRHLNAHAYCIVLGEEEYMDNPKHAQAFLNDHWFSIDAGDVVDIPPNTAHGFTIGDGGILHFLSVQTPPIESLEGEDDYILVNNVVKPVF